VASLHLRHHPIFSHWDFCTILEWEMSWGTKVMLRVFPESTGNTLNYSLQRYYKLVVKEYPFCCKMYELIQFTNWGLLYVTVLKIYISNYAYLFGTARYVDYLTFSHLNPLTNPTPLPNATLTIGATARNPNYRGSRVYPNYRGSCTQP
jgi:hypothetical protein